MRASPSSALVIFACVAVIAVVGLGMAAIHDVDSRSAAHDKAVAAAAWQAHLKRKAEAWQAHLKREAWNKAHPEEVARRKAEEQARLAREHAAQQEAAREKVEADRVAAAQRSEQDARAAKEAHPCDTSGDLSNAAADALNNDNQKTYDLAVSGLHYAEECDNDTVRTVRKGYLLSFKAMAEHSLTSGDSRTDMNQAISLLVECQTLPGLYGTKVGAGCETQEEYDIRAKTNWEMQEYSQ